MILLSNEGNTVKDTVAMMKEPHRKRRIYMIQIDVQKLEEKIHIEYHMSMEAAHERSLQVEKRCPKQLYINVYQWIKGEEISDIYIGKYSLPMILSIWKSNDFLRALEVICELSQGDTEKAEFNIWEMRR